MNDHKIAFIACVNDDDCMKECRYYIERLYVPQGFTTQILEIHDAKSMTSGYNEAMRQTDAKYKIYLHQDTFLIRRDMLHRMLEIFSDPQVGMLGVIGGDLQKDAGIHHYWNKGHTLSATYRGVKDENLSVQSEERVIPVEAADGMFLATQRDIPWDERIDQWHMYDVAQSIRFRDAGYRVFVLNETRPWTLHDAGFCSEAGYDTAMKKIASSYPEDFNYAPPDWELITEDMDTVYMDEIYHEINKREKSSGGTVCLPEDMTAFSSLYNRVKYCLYRMIFGMPRADWKELIDMLITKQISASFLTEMIGRCTLDPTQTSEELNELLGGSDTTEMFFDQYQRYHSAADIIRRDKMLSVKSCVTILEVGANAHRNLGRELPGDEIIYTDLKIPEKCLYDNRYLEADACDMRSISDGSYDYCVALDVFEHIPPDQRRSFLTELHRVCRRAVVCCFPQGRDEVARAEEKVNEFHRQIFGEDNPWLLEHRTNGLPDCETVNTYLQEVGIPFTSFTHGSIDLWEKLTTLNTLIDDANWNQMISDANIRYNRECYASDTGETDYRVFYILGKAAFPEILRIGFQGKTNAGFVDELYDRLKNR